MFKAVIAIVMCIFLSSCSSIDTTKSRYEGEVPTQALIESVKQIVMFIIEMLKPFFIPFIKELF